MLETGVQTKNIIHDACPEKGFEIIKKAGFSCCDFSLNAYLTNTSIYKQEMNDFFDKSEQELEVFFAPHREAARVTGIKINQMHMPYPNYIPGGKKECNDYLRDVVAIKSMYVCHFLKCPYIVIHGFKLAKYLGSEEAEWKETEKFIDFLAPTAKEMGITICMENLYTSVGNRLIEGPCCNAEKAVERIDRINEKYRAEVLGFCFDTGHANLVGIDFESFLAALGNRIKVLHIHDNDGIGDLHQIPFTFAKGCENIISTDWDSFVRGMRKINFTGVLNFETAPVLAVFPDEMKMDVLEFIAKTGKYFAEKISYGRD